MTSQRAATLFVAIGCLALGVFIGSVGTVMHRAVRPWGVVLALATVVAAAVLARAWGRYLGLVGFGLGMIAVVQVLSGQGPGGDVLVPGGDGLSLVWVVGSAVLLAVAAFAPGRWFAERIPEQVPAHSPDRP